jgi:hypothetical protein
MSINTLHTGDDDDENNNNNNNSNNNISLAETKYRMQIVPVILSLTTVVLLHSKPVFTGDIPQTSAFFRE